MRRIAMAVAVATLLTTPREAAAAEDAWIQVLPQFVPQGISSGGDCFGDIAVGISGDGETVVGNLQNGHAGAWTQSGGVQELPTFSGWSGNHWAIDSNTDGTVLVGTGYDDDSQNVNFGIQAALWENAVLQGLGWIFNCSSFCNSLAYAISRNSTTIVGDYRFNQSYGAFRGDADGIASIPLRGARGVSDSGAIVVGKSTSGFAAYWQTTPQPLGTVNIIPPIPGVGPTTCATGVSANGQTIVGYGGNQPFRWTAASGTADLGTLEPTTAPGYATDVSADGSVVVGQSAAQAFIWSERTGLRRLADELVLRRADLTGITLTDALAVSDNGRTIVGRQVSPGRVWVAYLPPDCNDGIDNDGDGLVDWPLDPGCQTQDSVREDPACQNGLDDDNDGKVDFDGGTSANQGTPVAAPDPHCADKPYRIKETPPSGCGLGAELALALAVSGCRLRRLAA